MYEPADLLSHLSMVNWWINWLIQKFPLQDASVDENIWNNISHPSWNVCRRWNFDQIDQGTSIYRNFSDITPNRFKPISPLPVLKKNLSPVGIRVWRFLGDDKVDIETTVCHFYRSLSDKGLLWSWADNCLADNDPPHPLPPHAFEWSIREFITRWDDLSIFFC